jgi:dolichol-phosphate mannosyltransferase
MDRRRDRGRKDLSASPIELSVVIPVYNEGESIAPTLRGLGESLNGIAYEIFVIYDFDEDNTVPAVRRIQPDIPNVVLQRNTLGRGVLNALKSGLAEARGTYILIMMADGSDDPATVPQMLDRARAGADLVAGSRYMRHGGQIGGPRLKSLMSRAAGLTLHWLAGIPTHDPTNNFKLYSRRLIEAIRVESAAGFELALELTVKSHLQGMSIAEVPTTWRDRTAGESRFELRKWLPYYLRWYRVGILSRIRIRA